MKKMSLSYLMEARGKSRLPRRRLYTSQLLRFFKFPIVTSHAMMIAFVSKFGINPRVSNASHVLGFASNVLLTGPSQVSAECRTWYTLTTWTVERLGECYKYVRARSHRKLNLILNKPFEFQHHMGPFHVHSGTPGRLIFWAPQIA